jgi:hypothetical protein
MVSARLCSIAGTSVILAGCSLVNDPGTHTGPSVDAAVDAPLPAPRLRVAHLSRDVAAVEVLVDDLPIASSLAFASVSMATDVAPGMHAFRVEQAGATLVERTLETSLGHQYTLTLFGDRGTPPFAGRDLALLLLDDDATGIDPSRDVRVAAVHVASPVVAGQLVAVNAGGNTLLADDFAFAGIAPLTLGSRPYTVGFDEGADGILDVEFDLPALVPGTYANVFVAARADDSVFLLVSTTRGAVQSIEAN